MIDKTPIIQLSKTEIVRKGFELNAPIHLSWSCYESEYLACGTGDSCALRLRGFEQAGVIDPRFHTNYFSFCFLRLEYLLSVFRDVKSLI